MRVSLLTQDRNATKIAFEVFEDDKKPGFIVVDWSNETDTEYIFRKQLIADHLMMLAHDRAETSESQIDDIIEWAMTCSVRVI